MRVLGGSDLSGVGRVEHARVTSGGWRTLQTLTAAQIALTLALLASAGLLLRSMYNAVNVTAGYQTRQILTMMVTDVGQDWQAFHARALERVNQLPGVAGAAFAWGLPLTNTGASTRCARSPRATHATRRDASLTVPVRAVTSSFFDLLDMQADRRPRVPRHRRPRLPSRRHRQCHARRAAVSRDESDRPPDRRARVGRPSA